MRPFQVAACLFPCSKRAIAACCTTPTPARATPQAHRHLKETARRLKMTRPVVKTTCDLMSPRFSLHEVGQSALAPWKRSYSDQPLGQGRFGINLSAPLCKPMRLWPLLCRWPTRAGPRNPPKGPALVPDLWCSAVRILRHPDVQTTYRPCPKAQEPRSHPAAVKQLLGSTSEPRSRCSPSLAKSLCQGAAAATCPAQDQQAEANELWGPVGDLFTSPSISAQLSRSKAPLAP